METHVFLWETLFCLGLIVVGFVYRSLKADRMSRLLSGWGTFARRKNGRIVKTGVIEVEIDETLILAEGYQLNRKEYYSRLRAVLPVPARPSFDIYPRRLIKSLTKIRPLPLAKLNDATFDKVFVVKTGDPELTRRLWSARARQLSLSHFVNGEVRCKDGVLRLLVPRILTDSELELAVELLVELAHADIFGLTALKAIPQASSLAPAGPWDERTLPCVELAGPPLVTLGPVVTAAGYAATQADCAEVLYPHELEVVVTEGRFSLPSVELPTGAAHELAQLGSGTLLVDRDQAAFLWDGIEVELPRLEAAIRLLGCFCRPEHSGIYR